MVSPPNKLASQHPAKRPVYTDTAGQDKGSFRQSAAGRSPDPSDERRGPAPMTITAVLKY